jgi:hypothetical protein
MVIDDQGHQYHDDKGQLSKLPTNFSLVIPMNHLTTQSLVRIKNINMAVLVEDAQQFAYLVMS